MNFDIPILGSNDTLFRLFRYCVFIINFFGEGNKYRILLVPYVIRLTAFALNLVV